MRLTGTVPGHGKVVTDCWCSFYHDADNDDIDNDDDDENYLDNNNNNDYDYDNYDDDVNIDCNAAQVSPLGQDAVQLKVEDETESHAWFVQLYHDNLMQPCYHNILCKNRQSLHDSFFGNTWQRQHNFFLSGDYDYHHDHLDADQDHDAVNEDKTRFHYGWFNQLDNNVDGDYNHPADAADDDVMTLWKPNSSWSAPCHSS